MKINRTVFRTIQILEYIAERPRAGVSIAELVREFQIPKTSIYDILTTLEHQHMLHSESGENKRYLIGLKAFSIGNRFSQQLDIVKVVQPYLQNLSQKLRQTSFLAVEDGDYIVYLGKYEPVEPIVTTANLGSRKPMYCTALGKALLASYSDEQIVLRLRGMTLEQKTEQTFTEIKLLLGDLQRTRKRGFAVDDREQEDYLQCVAAPLYNHRSEVQGAISISFIYTSDIDILEIGKIVCDAALNISHQMSYPEAELYP